MNAEPPLCRNHPTGAARKKIIKHLHLKTRDSHIKPQQQSHNFSIIQSFSIHTNYGSVCLGSTPMAFKGSCSRDNATATMLKQLTEELLVQSWTMS